MVKLQFFQQSCTDVRVGPYKRLGAEEFMLLNCGVGVLWRLSWTSGRPNQSILKEINPEYSLEGLMLMLKLQYFGHLMQRADSLEKTAMLGKTEGRRRHEMIGWHYGFNGHEFEQNLGDGEGQGSLAC